VQGGEDVRVVDNDSGEDLTAVTFAQIIYEEAKRANGTFSLPLLRWLIRRGDEAVRDVMRGVERGREALENVRDAAEKRVQSLVPKGRNSRKLLGDLMEVPQRRLDELQRRIDSQVRESVERVTHHPAFRKEIQRVERSIHQLEKQLGKLTKTRKQPTRRRGKAKK
jgi:polyhydroxyalkanoate synthesis regulator protein